MIGPAYEACQRAARRRRFGYIPDKREHIDVRPHVRELVGTPLRAEVSSSKDEYCDPNLDQGDEASCGGHGTSQAFSMATKSIGAPLGFQASPGYFYRGARRISTPATLAGGTPLTDSGIDPNALILFCKTLGTVPIGFDGQCPTPDGRWSDVYAANVNTDIALDAEIQGRKRLDFDVYNIDASSSPDAIAAQISPVIQTPGLCPGYGIFVDSAFENWDPSQGPLDGAVNFGDPNGGGHWLPGTKFQVASGSQGRLYSMINSWSSSWGDQGRITVTEKRFCSMLSQVLVFKAYAEAA